jgi:hypothetical protein
MQESIARTAPVSLESGTRHGIFDGIKRWIVGATGVLLVLPAMVNSGIDVYKAVLKLPRTEVERISAELYKKYFEREPVAERTVQISRVSGVLDLRVAVYQDGDVLVKGGGVEHWVPFTQMSPTRASWSLISNAVAESVRIRPPTDNRGVVAFRAESRLSGSVLTREKLYSDGILEQRKVDINSGRVLSESFFQVDKPQSLEGFKIPTERALKIEIP